MTAKPGDAAMMRQQFRVLYRDFLFRVVDRDVLSTYAKGDASQLLLQLVALLVCLSALFSLPVLMIDPAAPAQARLMFAWSVEHFLIATTMLVVGVFSVLSWDSMFPGHRDVLVLGPLPIRAHTILLAKLAAVATALGLAVLTMNLVVGVLWPLAVNASALDRDLADALPASGGVGSGLRLLAAYWATMLAAGVFIFGLAMSAQGLAASLLPRRHFLRVSSLLQLSAFCLVVGGYLLQSPIVRPGTTLAAQQGGMLSSSPSYWFLGLFQELSGSSVLAPLARRAWAGLGLAVFGTAIAYALLYFRALRRIAEQPDITPSVSRVRWLPAFGDGPQTALVQFSVRTLCRSAPHRVILAFYWGLGFTVAMLAVKTPRGQQLADAAGTQVWHETSVPLLISSIVMAGFAVVAARLAFAMPRDLRANWIVVQESVDVRGGQDGRAGWHAEYGNAVAKLDVSVDQPLEHTLDEGVDRLTRLGSERCHLLRQAVIARRGRRRPCRAPLIGGAILAVDSDATFSRGATETPLRRACPTRDGLVGQPQPGRT